MDLRGRGRVRVRVRVKPPETNPAKSQMHGNMIRRIFGESQHCACGDVDVDVDVDVEEDEINVRYYCR